MASSITPVRIVRQRWRVESSSWSTASLTSTTTSTMRCAPESCSPVTCPSLRSSCSARLARRGSTRWSGISSIARPPPATLSRARRWAGRCCVCASSCSTASTWARRRAASTNGPSAPYAASSITTWSIPTRFRRVSSERVPTGCRLPGGDDRPLLHRPFCRADDPRGDPLLMALISQESLERVKQTADIVEVISAHTDLRRQGARWVGLCPFHEERTPSFSVDAQGKLYHCFGCGVGGDTIKFVEEKEGIGFAEAVELLADRYGVELEREKEDPRAEARRQQRRRLGELLDRTAGFYAHYLWDSEEAGKARAYLAERGLGEETLRAFAVGYAPSAWDTVLMRGQRAGFKVDELRAVGLAQRGRSGGEYDRFRERIMFPIRDRRGRTLGFGGRAMRSDQGAKYVNTAETDFFHKSQMLYGIDLAKRRSQRAAGRLLPRAIPTFSRCTRLGLTRRYA